MKFFQAFNPFRKPTASNMATIMLEDARRELLLAQSAKEWAESQVSRYTKAIERLQKEVK